jgi:hypothetical protein
MEVRIVISVTGLVLTREHRGFGYVVLSDGIEILVCEDTLISMSKEKELSGAYIREENYNGEEHIFIDFDEEVTENLLYDDEALQKYGAIK